MLNSCRFTTLSITSSVPGGGCAYKISPLPCVKPFFLLSPRLLSDVLYLEISSDGTSWTPPVNITVPHRGTPTPPPADTALILGIIVPLVVVGTAGAVIVVTLVVRRRRLRAGAVCSKGCLRGGGVDAGWKRAIVAKYGIAPIQTSRSF